MDWMFSLGILLGAALFCLGAMLGVASRFPRPEDTDIETILSNAERPFLEKDAKVRAGTRDK